MTVLAGIGTPARAHLIRTMNEQMLLDHIRSSDSISRADLSRISGLAKNTVSLALANLERAGLVRVSGIRTGLPGPAAVLYEVRPECGYVLALDVGSEYLRGAVQDITGTVRARKSVPATAATGLDRVAELVALANVLLAESGLRLGEITQTVIGSPGIYDPQADALMLAGAMPGWDAPGVLTELRRAFGPSLMIENDVDAAALAERAHGHGRGVDTFAFVSVGTGIGMGLVLGGRLHRGAHGAAGEIGYLPLDQAPDTGGEPGAGTLENAASASGIVRAAIASGMPGPLSARDVFTAAARGDERAGAVVAAEAVLVARAVCAVITVADPELVILGGGVGQAAGFIDAVGEQLRRLAPVLPELRVSALGDDAVVDGCLAAGLDRAWLITTEAALR